MRKRARLALPVILAVFLPASCFAQYMYLDTNGDGVLTPADVVSPTGQTTVGVWLRTDTNRDRSAASCPTGDGDLTFNLYEFILHASNGTIRWGDFVNHQPSMALSLGDGSSATDYHNGLGGGITLPPGTYHLASVLVEVGSGTPSLSIAAATQISGVLPTLFGSSCSGNDSDNLLKLGTDWFDADGVPYGGVANRAPVLAQPADMALAEGSAQDQELTAADPDGDALNFTLVTGPPYASVTTVTPGSGAALGRVRLAPGYRDAGTTSATVEARDGFATDRKSFAITVTDVNGPPTMTPLGDITMREGEMVERPLSALDPEGDPVTFTLVSGPRSVTVTTIATVPASGWLRVAPGFAEAGTATVTVSASDGALSDEESFHLTVVDPFPVHNQVLCEPADMLVVAGRRAEQALHAASPDGQPVTFLKVSGPDFATVSTVSSYPAGATGTITLAPAPADVGSYTAVVAATDGIATDPHAFLVSVAKARTLPDPNRLPFSAPFLSFDVGLNPQSVAAGDLDADGLIDLVTANLNHSLTILRGRGNGFFERKEEYPLGGAPYSVAIGDLNGDSRPDLAVPDSALDIVAVVFSIGACEFGRRLDVAVGDRPAYVKIGDWNRDGRPDLAAANENAGSVSILLGNRDGTFRERADYAVGNSPCYIDSDDFNGDGVLDLATANEESGSVSILLGNVDGTFQPRVAYLSGHDSRAVETGDLNGDGVPDLAVANFFPSTVSVLLGNGNGTFQPRIEIEDGLNPWSIAVGDLNGDGKLDIATANVGSSTAAVLLGDGTGRGWSRTNWPAAGLSRFIVISDPNRDGQLDIIVAGEGSGTVAVLLGHGDGTFGSRASIPAGESPLSVIAGDFNGDGKADIAAANIESATITIALGDGLGNFAPGATLVTMPSPVQLLSGDWNGDGRLDLAVASAVASAVSTFPGTGDGSFGARSDYPVPNGVNSVATGELNGDGAPDFVVAGGRAPSLTILNGGRDGVFQRGSDLTLPGTTFEVEIGDLNTDGHADLAVPQYAPAAVLILLGNGDGTFAPAPSRSVSGSLGSIALGDLDGDGVPDLAASVAYIAPFSHYPKPGAVATARGNGDGTFGPWSECPTPRTPAGLLLADVTGDGLSELVGGNSSSSISIYFGLGGGALGARIDLGTGFAPLSIAAGDWNGDGRPDLAVPGYASNRVELLFNRGQYAVVDRAPVLVAPRRVEARVEVPVRVSVSAIDPDGDPIAGLTADLTSLPRENDAVFKVISTHAAGKFTWTPRSGDVGRYEVRFIASNRRTTVAVTEINVGTHLTARAFLTPEDRVIRLFSGRPFTCVRIEPIDGAFLVADIDLTSITMRSTGTGSVGEIFALPSKHDHPGDRDRNGVADIAACFGIEELRRLFGGITGQARVPVSVAGSVASGGRFSARLELDIRATPGRHKVAVSPNPLNPVGALQFTTSKPGPLRVTLYDLAGRRVETLAEEPLTPAGFHEVRINGRDGRGAGLASGVYFYRVESVDGVARGKFTVLR